MSRTLGFLLALVATYGLALYAFGCDGSHRVPLSTSPPVPADPAGCPTAPTQQPGDPAPRRSITTAEGVSLSYPVWLDLPVNAAERQAMIDEIRAEQTPAGTTLVVLDPGGYYAPGSPTGLAAGEWHAPSTIYVAWRGVPSDPRRLPALRHEIQHVITQDPSAGH